MCAPALIPVALAAAQQGMSYIAGSQQASANAAYNNQLQIAVDQEYDSNINQAQTHAVYQGDEAAQKIQQEQLQVRSGEATALASAGSNGAAGNSVSALARDYINRGGQYDASVNENRDAQLQILRDQMVGFGYQRTTTFNQMARNPNGPNPLTAVVGLAPSVLGFAQSQNWLPNDPTVASKNSSGGWSNADWSQASTTGAGGNLVPGGALAPNASDVGT